VICRSDLEEIQEESYPIVSLHYLTLPLDSFIIIELAKQLNGSWSWGVFPLFPLRGWLTTAIGNIIKPRGNI